VRIMGTADVHGAASATPLVRAAFPIFLGFEDGQDVLESPALRPVLGPTVEVTLQAAGPDHGIDAGPATEHMTQGHVEFAADVVEPDAGIEDGRRIVVAPGLKEQNLRARL
jgi:hypothetical protein